MDETGKKLEYSHKIYDEDAILSGYVGDVGIFACPNPRIEAEQNTTGYVWIGCDRILICLI